MDKIGASDHSTLNLTNTLGKLFGSKSKKDFDPNLRAYIPHKKNRSWYTPCVIIYFLIVSAANTLYTMLAKEYGLILIALDLLIIAHLIYLTCTLQDMNICMTIIVYIMKALQLLACIFALIDKNKNFTNTFPITSLCLFVASSLVIIIFIVKEKVIYLTKKQVEMIDNANEEDEEVNSIINNALNSKNAKLYDYNVAKVVG